MYHSSLLSKEGENFIISTLKGFTINLFAELVVFVCGVVRLGQTQARNKCLKTCSPSEFCVPHGERAAHCRTSQVSGKELLDELRTHWIVCDMLPQ